MALFICYLTRDADNLPRRVEVEAPNPQEAVRIALGGHAGRCSVRSADQTTVGLDMRASDSTLPFSLGATGRPS